MFLLKLDIKSKKETLEITSQLIEKYFGIISLNKIKIVKIYLYLSLFILFFL